MSQNELNSQEDKLDLFFSDKLGKATARPPEHVWERIEKSLDEKKRKRFFWWLWSGIGFSVLIGAAILLPFLYGGTKKPISTHTKQTELKESDNHSVSAKKENNLSAENLNTKESIANNIETTSETKTEAITNIHEELTHSTNKEETKAVEKTLVQLGAFKNEVEPKVFSNISYPVVMQKGKDGYTRYFAEINAEPDEAIQALKDKGFASAYINKHVDKNIPFESLREASPTIAQQTKETHHTTQMALASTSANASSAPAKVQYQKSQAVSNPAQQPEAAAVNTKTKQEANEAKQNTLPINTNNGTQTRPVTSNETATTNTTNLAANKQAEETANTNTTSVVSNTSPAKDSTSVVAADEEKKDSAETKKQEKPTAPPDSSLVKKDSLKNIPFPKWAVSLEGGPLLFIKNTQTSLFNTANEKEQLTYNGGIKAEYSFTRYLSLMAGVNYSTFIAQQDATLFYFPKNINTDYNFYTSYGTMTAGSSTLLQGFNPAPWITTLHAEYAYQTQVSYLSLPIQANLTYLRTKRVSLFVNAGVNMQFAIAQQNHLQLIKEHETDKVDNNNLTANKFAFSLLGGLGCDIKLFKHIYFTASPSFVYGFSNLSNTAGVKNTPQYFMGNAGIKIKW